MKSGPTYDSTFKVEKLRCIHAPGTLKKLLELDDPTGEEEKQISSGAKKGNAKKKRRALKDQ
jgi:hypothetical protein